MMTSEPLVVEQAWDRTLALARSHDLSAFGASYLELALRFGLPLASLDDKLLAAAKTAGVANHKP